MLPLMPSRNSSQSESRLLWTTISFDAKIRQKYNNNSSNKTKKTPKRVEEENNEEEEEDEMTSGVTKRYVRRAPNSRIIEEYFIEPTISSASPGIDTSLRLNEANIVRKRQLKRSSSETAMRGEDESTSSSSSSGFGLTKSKSSKNLAGMSSLKTYIKNRNAINIYDSMPHEFMPPLFITNQNEVKKKFLESNVPPVLKFKGDNRSIKNILGNYSKPNYTHFFKAKEILDSVRGRYPSMNAYYEANFGKKVSSETCVDIIGKYLSKNRITGDITVNFAPGLTCSGRIASYGQKNKPETRRFLVWINNDEENQFLRRKGIVSLCDHEIGTHYYRAFNDGLQIWYGDREKFGLRPLNSTELLKTEEGLAALHTLMNADLEYLFLPALLYYLVCMAERMTFEQLFNHMEKYIELPAERWKLVTRVKRGISDPHTRGCYSRDQSYFEGAVEILQNLDSIDFFLLMSGKLCLDELEKVKRLAKTDQIKVPAFFKSIKAYKEKLRHIGIVNGIIEDGNNHREEVVLDLQTKQRRELNPNRPMASYEIERFINNEIVAKTKNTIDIKPPPNIDPNNANSSLCAIL